MYYALLTVVLHCYSSVCCTVTGCVAMLHQCMVHCYLLYCTTTISVWCTATCYAELIKLVHGAKLPVVLQYKSVYDALLPGVLQCYISVWCTATCCVELINLVYGALLPVVLHYYNQCMVHRYLLC